MLGIITLLIALSAQFGLLIYRLTTKNRQTRVKHIIQIAAFVTFAFLMATGVYRWGFRWSFQRRLFYQKTQDRKET